MRQLGETSLALYTRISMSDLISNSTSVEQCTVAKVYTVETLIEARLIRHCSYIERSRIRLL